jgi:aminopeptidase YwaD
LVKNPYLDVEKKIMSEISTTSETMENLEILCDVHGSRFPGTPGDLGSVKFMVEKLESYGIENVHTQNYEIWGYERGHATLEVTSPIKKEFDVISLPGSISGEVETTLVDLGAGHPESYTKRKDEIDGNIAMVSSKLPLGIPRMHRSEKFNRSVLAGAAGWIFMNHYPAYGPPTGGLSSIIPAIGISYEDGTFLQRLVKREGEVKVRVKTTDKNYPIESYNVIGDIPGSMNTKEHVITGCHYDGHDISQGAHDPASGVAVVMEMARVINMVKDKLKRRARFILFGAEETGLYGSRHYVKTHQDELDDCRFMLNLDSAGGAGNKGLIFTGYPELYPLAGKWAKEMKTDIPVFSRVSGASDHWPFFQNRVPTANGGDPLRTYTGRGYGHTKYDTLDKIELKYLRLASANYSRILFRAANEENWPVKRKTQEEVDALVKASMPQDAVDLRGMVLDYVKAMDSPHPDTEAWLKRQG